MSFAIRWNFINRPVFHYLKEIRFHITSFRLARVLAPNPKGRLTMLSSIGMALKWQGPAVEKWVTYFLSKLTSLITLTNDSSRDHNVILRNNQTFHFCLIYSRSWQSWNCEVPWWMAKRWEGRRRQRRQQAQVRASRRDESQSCQSFVIKKPCLYLLPTRCLFLEMPPSAKKKAEKVEKKRRLTSLPPQSKSNPFLWTAASLHQFSLE